MPPSRGTASGGDEVPVAYVVPGSPALDVEDVRAWVAERVAPYKRLQAVHVVAS